MASNSIPLVAHKDTIVRIYVATENLDGFLPEYKVDAVDVSGELRILNTTVVLPPLKSSLAQPRAKINRAYTNHTLNFRIPAALASQSISFQIAVWTKGEFEAPPFAIKTRPWVSAVHKASWVNKTAFKVRYVRISDGRSTAPTDLEARQVILKAFDLLPTPPTDILPARLSIAHTSVDIDTLDGLEELVDNIDDQHDCTLSEALFPWEDECPDADGAVWIGVLPRAGFGGIAQGPRWFNVSRNTAIVTRDQIVAAHEMGHTLGLAHVNPNLHQGLAPIPPFDTLPNGGSIRAGDAFNPSSGEVVPSPVWDFMSYGVSRWVSPTNWMRLFDMF